MSEQNDSKIEIPALVSGWLRRDKRLAIYLRDACRCAYCGSAVIPGAHPTDAGVDSTQVATIDHVRPRADFIRATDGSPKAVKRALAKANRESNLVTACSRCNSSKQDAPRADWSAYVERELSVDAVDMWARVDASTALPLTPYRRAAKRLLDDSTLADLERSTAVGVEVG